MNSYILYPVLELKGFIILSVAVLGILTALLLISMGRKRKGIGSFGWYGLFLGLTKREILLTSLGISQVCLIFSLVIFSSGIGIVQISALALICVLRAILGLSLAGAVNEAVYAALAMVAVMAANMLRDYMRETGVELYIGAVWILLSLFILQYSLYYFFKGLERMLQRHEMAIQRQ